MTGRPQKDRRARLQILSRVPLVNSRGVKQEQLLDITDLRISFKHQKSWKWAPNVGHFTAYNLADSTRANMQGSGNKAILYAGYGDFVSLVGTIDGRVTHKQEGTEVSTKVEGGDGGRAHRYAWLNKSYAKRAFIRDVVADLATQLGKEFTTASKALVARALGDKRFSGGYSTNGYAAPALQDIFLANGLTFSIQDDQLLVLERDGKDSFKAGEEVFDINPDTGLIGSPDFSAPPHPGKPQLLKGKSLLNTSLKVGAKFNLQSRFRKGIFKIWTITHLGDTYGGDWYSEFEGQLLKGGR